LSVTIHTVGHSTHPIEVFIAMLEAHGIRQLVDVRTIPRSRHNPQFSRENLPSSLQRVGIRYVHMKGLGGMRKPQPDSANTGWRNASFRGYADHMQSEDFRASLAELIALASKAPTAIMCAEAVPWRCHRSLIGDALTARGVEVIDILSATKTQPHVLTPFADVHGTEVTYPVQAAFRFERLSQ
jgi:uncharacterized protein (DUF488 family)